MVTKDDILNYQGRFYARGRSNLYVPPHALLQPYLSNYTVSFPSPQDMPDDYTVLPSASCTLVLSVSDTGMSSGLRGVNTRACAVGAHANKMRMLLLVEFRPGGLYPFLPVDQRELLDSSVSLDLLDRRLQHAVETALERADGIQGLIGMLDDAFLSQLSGRGRGEPAGAILSGILAHRGEASVAELSEQFHYSPKQMDRLFSLRVGTTPKLFSRIVRVNHALRLLQAGAASLTDVAMQSGYFDQPHFIHDFKAICGLTPREYMRKMSVFYNDRYKI